MTNALKKQVLLSLARGLKNQSSSGEIPIDKLEDWLRAVNCLCDEVISAFDERQNRQPKTSSLSEDDV